MPFAYMDRILPSLSIQEDFVAELDSYQKIIDGARQVVENYKPSIPISSSWEVIPLRNLCENLDSKRIPITSSDRETGDVPYYGASGIVDYVKDYIFDEPLLLISEDGANLLARSTPIAFSISGKTWVNNHAHVLKFNNIYTQRFVEFYINQVDISQYITGAAQPKLSQANLNKICIPCPNIEVQEKIVREIESVIHIVEQNKRLIDRVFALIKNDILQLYSSTLNDPDFYDPDIRAYLDPTQQVQEEIVKKYSFSRFELNWCRKFNIKQLESSENYASKKELHIALSKYYKELKSEL